MFYSFLIVKIENALDDFVESKPSNVEVSYDASVDMNSLIEDFVEVTKGGKKKSEIYTKRGFYQSNLIFVGRVHSQFSDSQSLQTKSSFPKKKNACIGNASCSLVSMATPDLNHNLSYIDHMPKFARPLIEQIVNVTGDGNCGFWFVARHMGMDEENHHMTLILELQNHKSDYV